MLLGEKENKFHFKFEAKMKTLKALSARQDDSKFRRHPDRGLHVSVGRDATWYCSR